MTVTGWRGALGALIATAILLGALWRPAAERGLVESGVAYTIATYDQILPLLGLGVALAQVNRLSKILATIIFVGGIVAGILGESQLVSREAAASGLQNLIAFIGPLCCVIAGLVLASPARLRAWAASAAAALAGAALGFLIAFHDSSMGDVRFSAGAAAAGLWLIVAPPLLLRHVERSWLTIGGRVFASWLIAMGLLLGGSSYVVKQRAERAADVERAMPPGRPALPHRPVVKVPY